MTPSCGRIRTPILPGLTPIVESELTALQFSTLSFVSDTEVSIQTGSREYAFVLIHGRCEAMIEGQGTYSLGPRPNPFEHPPYALFVTRDSRVVFCAGDRDVDQPTLIGIGSAPAERQCPNAYITPDQVSGGQRGADNWQRTVRMVCWSDNTEGNMLLAGETCTPSGNWSTVPPHRHERDIPDVEAPYEEVYFFQFSRPQGFGLARQFDDDGQLDQAFSLVSGDALYMAGGYHPVGCAPGSTLYHLSLMAGPQRISRASVHKDYRFLLDEKQIENQYKPSLR